MAVKGEFNKMRDRWIDTYTCDAPECEATEESRWGIPPEWCEVSIAPEHVAEEEDAIYNFCKNHRPTLNLR